MTRSKQVRFPREALLELDDILKEKGIKGQVDGIRIMAWNSRAARTADKEKVLDLDVFMLDPIGYCFSKKKRR